MTAYRRWMWLFVALLAAGCVIGILVPAGLGWDFANFYDAGRRIAAGQVDDLYRPRSLIAGLPPQGTTGFFGTPLSALLYVPMSGLAPETALIAFKIQNVLAFAATFIVLLAFYRPFASSDASAQARYGAVFAFLFLIYQPFWTIFRVGGQTTPTVLLLLTLGLVAHVRAQYWGAALCLGLAGLIKPALAPALLFLACVSGVAFLWRLATVLAAAGLVSLVALGWPIHAAFLDLMRRSSGTGWAWYFNSSLYIVLDNLREYAGGPGAAGAANLSLSIATYALRLVVVITLVSLIARSRRASLPAAARRHFDFTLATIFFLVWSPTVWEHYLSLLFPFLVYLVATREYFRRDAIAIVGLIFILSVFQNLILINWLRERFAFDSLPGLIGIGLLKSGPLVLTMVLLWRHGGELIRSHTGETWRNHPRLISGGRPA
jgi:hypothetical protein